MPAHDLWLLLLLHVPVPIAALLRLAAGGV